MKNNFINLWKRFVNGEIEVAGLSSSIAKSWKRCRDKGVNIETAKENIILTSSLLKERIEQNESLINASQKVLPYIYGIVRGSNNMIILCDNRGYILRTIGDPPFLTKAQQVQLSVGACWTEEIKGTNAIGTSIVEESALKVLGCEHYIRENHFLSCWASPIFDPKGKLVGVLDISGQYSDKDNRFLEIAFMGARMIEQNLLLNDLQEKILISNNSLKLLTYLLNRNFIKIDDNGYIEDITQEGANLIKSKRQDVIGKNIKEIFQTKKDFYYEVIDLNFSNEKNSYKECFDKYKFEEEDLGKKDQFYKSIIQKEFNQNSIIFKSNKMQEILKKAAKIAKTDISVLIQGESGTGKELFARFIHNHSLRKDKPFIAINCSAIPSNLIESELFGYVEGAFTGAKKGGNPGKFELANGGTIFLDEIGDIPPQMQLALLRVLQEKEFYRVGDNKVRKIDVRVIAATNKDLKKMVDEGTFRVDLYYRINVFIINIPPLRERKEDIQELTKYFIEKATFEMCKRISEIDDKVYDYFLNYNWPGNVRELENVIYGIVALCDDDKITSDYLPEEIKKINYAKDILINEGKSIDEITKLRIMNVLQQTKWRIAPAAKILGMGRTTLYRKLKEYNIIS